MAITQRRAAKSRTTDGQMVFGGWSGIEPNKKAPPNHFELAEQKQLFFFLKLWEKRYPVLEWVHSSLNGVPLTGKVAKDASESGMRSGVWDVFVPCKRKGYTSFYIEMKWGKNDLTVNQERFRQHLHEEGYLTAKAYSAIAAARAILDYLDIRDDWIEDTLRMNLKASTRAEPIYCNTPDA